MSAEQANNDQKQGENVLIDILTNSITVNLPQEQNSDETNSLASALKSATQPILAVALSLQGDQKEFFTVLNFENKKMLHVRESCKNGICDCRLYSGAENLTPFSIEEQKLVTTLPVPVTVPQVCLIPASRYQRFNAPILLHASEKL